MAEYLDVLNTAISLLIRAALLAACFSGRVRKRSLQRLAGRNADAKAQEILFLKDRISTSQPSRLVSLSIAAVLLPLRDWVTA